MKRPMHRTFACLIALSLFAGAAAQAQTRDEITRENYRRLMNGEISLGELSPQQREDIVELDRRIREGDKRTPGQRCYDAELEKLAQPPSVLARRSAAFKCGISFEQAEAGRAQ
jgi:hypothetical protein